MINNDIPTSTLTVSAHGSMHAGAHACSERPEIRHTGQRLQGAAGLWPRGFQTRPDDPAFQGRRKVDGHPVSSRLIARLALVRPAAKMVGEQASAHS